METSFENAIQIRFNLALENEATAPFKLDVDLTLPGNGITAIYGHSGSGKTTLLRCIAGLETRQSGQLIINGETWQNETCFRPVHKRPLGYVFQEASLFPHLSARQNLEYGAKRAAKKPEKNQQAQIIEMLGIEHLLAKYPEHLSGGEKQRVAIARALLVNPQILLMDEPLSSLDEQRKQEVLPYLERLRDQLKLPIIYVTHSLNEVTRLAQQAVLLKGGAVISYGALNEVFSHANCGLDNNLAAVIDAHIVAREQQWHLLRCQFDGGELWLSDDALLPPNQVRIRIAASDVSISLDASSNSSILNRLESKVVAIRSAPDSAMTLVTLQTGRQKLLAQLTNKSVHHLGLKPQMTVWAQIKSAAIVR